MHKASLALAVLGSSLTLAAQNCGGGTLPAQEINTYSPYGASFYSTPGAGTFGAGACRNLYVDIVNVVDIDLNFIRTTLYNQIAAVPMQVGSTFEARIFVIPGTASTALTNQSAWGIDALGVGTADGLPEWHARCVINAFAAGSTIDTFVDPVNFLPVTATLPAGSWGICIECIPTTHNGFTPGLPVNLGGNVPGEIVIVIPNAPAAGISDQFVNLSSYSYLTNAGWNEVDLSGALVPSGTVGAGLSTLSLNLDINYTPGPTSAISQPYGKGCYDFPRMMGENQPEASNATPSDLANTNWELSLINANTEYVLIPGTAGPFVAPPPHNGGTVIELVNNTTPSATSSSSWDDAIYNLTLSVVDFPTGFPHPGDGGSPATDVTIQSNGSVYLGNTTAATFDVCGAPHGSTAPFRDELSRLAAFMNDLDPTDAINPGTITVEQPGPHGGLRVTWDCFNWDSATPPFTTQHNQMQLDLLPDGRVFMAFGNLGNGGSNSNNAIIGYSAGLGEPLDLNVDWDNGVGSLSGAGDISPTLALDARPVYNATVNIEINNVSAGTGAGIIVLSFGHMGPTGVPFPSLGLPLPGCDLHVDINPGTHIANLFTFGGPPTMSTPFTMPPSTLGNFQMYLQAGTFTPNPHNTLPALVTQGLCLKVGQ